MEDNMNFVEMPMQTAPFFSFDSPKGQSSFIKVIGVGGGGGNAVNHMYREGIAGVDFIVCNTDMKALGASPVPNKIPLGSLGLGAGGRPEKAKKAALAKSDAIKDALSHNTQMLFITAGMGGGTGTGAAPVIAEIAKSIELENEENEEILVVAIVTRPFTFEGRERMEQAEAGIRELRKKVDSIIIIDNDKLFAYGDLTMSQAYAMADDVLLTAAKGIAEIISKEGYVSRDFQDIKSVMEHSDKALMGIGSGRGENRAKDAINAAATSVLLDDSDITGAKKVLLYFTSSHEHEMRIREQMEITDYVCQATGGYADVKYGAGYDDDLGDELRVTLIATGFEKKERNDNDGSTQAESDQSSEASGQLPTTDHQPQATASPDPSEPYLKTTEPVNEQPVVDSQQTTAEPAKTDNGRHVHPLYEEMPKADDSLKKEKTEPVPTDKLVDGIKMITREPAPQPAASTQTLAGAQESVTSSQSADASTPTAQLPTDHQPQSTAPIFPSKEATHAEEGAAATTKKTTVATMVNHALHTDMSLLNSSDRIRKIHEILRGDPNGADKIASMTTQQIAAGDIDTVDAFSVPHSSKREAARYSVQPDGTVVEVPTLHGHAD